MREITTTENTKRLSLTGAFLMLKGGKNEF